MKNLRGFVCIPVVLLTLAGAGRAGAAGVETRLADAAMKRDVAAVRALIAQKVDVNAPGTDGSPALHWAVRVDDAAMARLLLGAGAQATLPNRYGLTPMAIAAGNGSSSMIAILLDAGADANAPDPAGETPLMSVTRVGRADAVTLLLDRGAQVDATDATYQQTALMVAVRENHPDIVKLLIARGAVGECADACWPDPVVGAAEFPARLRPRHRHRPRRIAGSRATGPDSGRHDSPAVRGERWPDGVGADAARRRRGHQCA